MLDVFLLVGGSVWGGEVFEWIFEGEVICLFDGGEIVMGGLLVCYYLMFDGCFIFDCNFLVCFFSDGCYFVLLILS